ncbi:cytidylyltransferase family-domain-containing protein [Haematococcus lacustris]
MLVARARGAGCIWRPSERPQLSHLRIRSQQHPTNVFWALAAAQPLDVCGSISAAPLEQHISEKVQSASASATSGDASAAVPAASIVSSATAPAAAPSARLAKRVFFGLMLGLGGGAVVLAGQLPFLATIIFVTYGATQEYYGFITSKGMAQGMVPPPPLVSSLTTVLCTSIALLAYFYGRRSGTVLAVSSILLLVMEVLTIRKPKFSQLTSCVFGLFYCGWLPSFWVKLRMLNTVVASTPVTAWLAGVTSLTVGLLATLTTVACVIAADTGAYFVGKRLGRTKLTEISPKKTVEGALGGLASSVAVALGCWKVSSWPATPAAAAVLGVLVFFSSLFGDLIESIMKRDAGMKDSGDLIPGHGGLLDRVDSYMFTGAVTFFYVVFVLPYFSL